MRPPREPAGPDAARGWLRIAPLAAVGCGGALGTAARAGVDAWLGSADGLPLPTFLVNVVGAFLLGALLPVLTAGRAHVRGLRLVAATGFLGAFTTYSALAVQTVQLATGGSPAVAAGYAVGTLVLGLLAAAAGAALGGGPGWARGGGS